MVSVSDFEPGDRIRVRGWGTGDLVFATIIDPEGPRKKYGLNSKEICFRIDNYDYYLDEDTENCHSDLVGNLGRNWNWNGVIHKASIPYDPTQQPYEDGDI